MSIHTNDTIEIVKDNINNLAQQPSTRLLRQTITSLERLDGSQSKVLGRGWMTNPDNSGTVLYYIQVVPTSPIHISYRPPHDGPGRGITIFFTSLEDLENSFRVIG